ncbi:hypothetical protein PPROV_000640300 [Pycnococcus provasolii]|uniref:Uncharacterized protein n=1 Tax=Pycnococcus provasolii TaxID=41880 RepID=A0A830HQE9_9CHLO|nr:hypothetical protein PPROV_000640300 [Pycnococcus provasolii]
MTSGGGGITSGGGGGIGGITKTEHPGIPVAKVVRQLLPNWNLLQHNRSCVVRNIGDNIARLSAIPCSTYTDEDRRSMVEQWNQGRGSLNILNDYIPQNDDEILFELGKLSKDAPPASRRLRRKPVDGSAWSVRTKLVYGGTDGTKTMNELAEDAPETWKGIQALCAELNASLPTRVQLNFYAEGLPEPSAGGPQHSYHIDPIRIEA